MTVEVGRALTESQLERLETIRAAYLYASAAANRDAMHKTAPPANTCRYCGFHWVRWNASKLDGHAKCIVTAEFKHGLALNIREGLLAYRAVADALDVSESVVRSWVSTVWGRR